MRSPWFEAQVKRVKSVHVHTFASERRVQAFRLIPAGSAIKPIWRKGLLLTLFVFILKSHLHSLYMVIEPPTWASLDVGYGDSDVHLLGEPALGKRTVQKNYQPARILERMKEQVRRQAHQFLILNVDPTLKSFLRDLTLEEFQMVLPELLSRYKQDTLDVIEDIGKDRTPFTQQVHEDGVSSIDFEVLPQGERMIEGADASVLVDGQAFVEGRNLEQLLGIPEAHRRYTVDSDKQHNLPSVFSYAPFLNSVLVPFNQNVVRRLGARAIAGERPKAFPILHRIHPANVIPQRVEGDRWRFVVTDLSTSFALDYASVAREMLDRR